MCACILTPYSLNTSGYGQIRFAGKTILHHRLVFAEANGFQLSQLKDIVVRHTCHNRQCINPAHLIAGTQQDNVNDTMQAGRWNGGRKRTLTTTQQAEIVAATRDTQQELATKYGVARATIARVLNEHKAANRR